MIKEKLRGSLNIKRMFYYNQSIIIFRKKVFKNISRNSKETNTTRSYLTAKFLRNFQIVPELLFCETFVVSLR